MKKKQTKSTAKSSGDATTIGPYNKPITEFWASMNWVEIINEEKLELKPDFESDPGEVGALYDWIDVLSENQDVSFSDAANWVLRKVLGDRFEDARRMEFQGERWDPDVQYTCRAITLQLCKNCGPNDIQTLSRVDRMIGSLLISEDEMLLRTLPINPLPC